jgi:uncharacterized membrane protein (UPF0127 family)
MALPHRLTGLTHLTGLFPLTRLTPVLGLVLLLIGCAAQSPPAAGSTQHVEIGGRAFTLELALDDQARRQGLSDRQEIAGDGGMLFVFPEPRRLQFVMRRCLTPIDIVFLGPSGRIVALHAMRVEPYDTPEHALRRYDSGWPAQFAIELRGGTLAQMDLKPGDPIALPLQPLKAAAQ